MIWQMEKKNLMHMKTQIVITLPGTNISPPKATFEDDFPRWVFAGSPKDTQVFSPIIMAALENGCTFERSRYTLSFTEP